MPPLARPILATLAALAGLAAAGPGPAPTPSPAASPAAPVPQRNIAGPGDYALRESIVSYYGRDAELRQETGYRLILVNGGAVFSGEFTSCARKMKALRVAAAERGIINVTDQASVAHNDLPDPELQKALRLVLEGVAPQIGLKDAAVEVQDGVATLRGTVTDFASRVHAEEAAGTVLGVTRIVNRLVPAGAPSGSDDASLQKAVTGFLGDWHQFGQIAEIDVQARQGVVTLSGRVALYLARQQAGVVASLVGGVTRVDNRIRVDPTMPPGGPGRDPTVIREKKP
jgi:osmotically-inducible protein OsmY